MYNSFGIDDIALKVPGCYLPIDILAKAREINPDKLKLGLGLEKMAVCDVEEDVVSLSAEAVIRLLEQNPTLKPHQIGRIYVGTESSIDGSKPISSYIHELVVQHFVNNGHNQNCMLHTDVIDMTFACIGAVDAMQNSLHYLQAHPDKFAIVVAADIANYDFESPGEYTQGAGAVAVLLSSNAKLMTFSSDWGIAMKSEHDFFKPIRLEVNQNTITSLHDEKPIFDGQFSNLTYQKRIHEAWLHFRKDEPITAYNHFVFHLPYAFHGRRIVTPLIWEQLKANPGFDVFCEEHQLDPKDPQILKHFSKTTWFNEWVAKHLSSGELFSSHIGNLYTASIFLSLMSTLEKGDVSEGQRMIFFAYGSGSKSKVFSGKLVQNFKAITQKWKTQDQLDKRVEIGFDQYINLRGSSVNRPISGLNSIRQTASGILETNRFERTYDLS